jgi:tRNA A22 N-methylase
LAEQPFEYPDMNTLPPMENIMDLTAVAAVKETFLQENDNAYEVIIVEFLEREKLNHCDKPVFFSDIVYKAEQTERCKRAAKPRRLFATYLFSSMLNLSAKRKIFIDQMVQNGPIELNFVQV